MLRKLLPVLSLALLASMSFAQGFIVPDSQPDGVKRHVPLQTVSQKVVVTINNGAAKTTLEQVFYNNHNRQVEGTYYFPVPKGAAVSEFYLYINGEKVKGEMLAKEKARAIYEDIVRRMQDPALLEYIDDDLFKARVFPIPPKGTRKIELVYSQVLETSGTLYKYIYPMKSRGKAVGKIKNSSIYIKLKSGVSLKSIYSPSHEIDVSRKGEKEAKISFEDSNYIPKNDFILYYSVSEKDLGLNLITYKEKGEDGYFLMMVSPENNVDMTKISAKEIVFVIDVSGSMKGDKIEQAKEALKFGVKSLNKGDKYNVIPFSTEGRPFFEGLKVATPGNIEASLKEIDDIYASGGTNIYEALSTALAMFSDDSVPHLVAFLTDGLPTVGNTQPKQIIKTVKEGLDENTRVFCFGVGYDVDPKLLDEIGQISGGTSDFVKPEENLEVKVSGYFDKINFPVLTNPGLKINSIKTYDIYPKELPDLFKGTQLMVTGRYRGSGSSAIRLHGLINGERKVYVFEDRFKAIDTETSFVANIWASRKIGYILSEIRLHGENKELKEEVIRLSKKFGIVTPYTSYLVLEDTAVRPNAPTRGDELIINGARPTSTKVSVDGISTTDKFLGESWFNMNNEVPEQVEVVFGTPMTPQEAAKRAKEKNQLEAMRKTSGKSGVEGSVALKDMRESDKAEESSRAVKKVGEKTFYRHHGWWKDSSIKTEENAVKIKYLSKEYFELLKAKPGLKKFFALGEKVKVLFEGKIYIVE